MGLIDSDAKKLFLAEFRNGTDITWFNDKEYYKTKIYNKHFGDLKKQFAAMKKNGLIVAMTPPQIISFSFKLAELKDECKKHNLKVSGKKDELAERIFETNPQFINKCKNKDMWICSVAGLEIVTQYYEEEKQREDDLKEKVMALIKSGNYKKAASEVEEFRNKRVFKDWMSFPESETISLSGEADTIKCICEETPKILQQLEKEYLEKARVLMSYDMLRGTNSIRMHLNEPTNISGISIGTVMMILMNYSCFKRDIKEWKKRKVVEGIQISGDNLCPECQKICGLYKWNEHIPEIPNPKCQDPENCRPFWLSYIKGMEPIVSTKPQNKKGFLNIFKGKH